MQTMHPQWTQQPLSERPSSAAPLITGMYFHHITNSCSQSTGWPPSAALPPVSVNNNEGQKLAPPTGSRQQFVRTTESGEKLTSDWKTPTTAVNNRSCGGKGTSRRRWHQKPPAGGIRKARSHRSGRLDLPHTTPKAGYRRRSRGCRPHFRKGRRHCGGCRCRFGERLPQQQGHCPSL